MLFFAVAAACIGIMILVARVIPQTAAGQAHFFETRPQVSIRIRTRGGVGGSSCDSSSGGRGGASTREHRIDSRLLGCLGRGVVYATASRVEERGRARRHAAAFLARSSNVWRKCALRIQLYRRGAKGEPGCRVREGSTFYSPPTTRL